MNRHREEREAWQLGSYFIEETGDHYDEDVPCENCGKQLAFYYESGRVPS